MDSDKVMEEVVEQTSDKDQVMEDAEKETNETQESSTESPSAPDTPTSETTKQEYPVYTEENPMKLPIETSEDFVVGIDLGNTTSVAAVAKLGELSHHPFVLHNSLGDLRHSALVSFGDTRILGTDAASQLVLSPTETIFDIKYLNNNTRSDFNDAHYPFKLISEGDLYTGVEIQANYIDNSNVSFPQLMGGLIHQFVSYAESDSLYWQFRDKILRQRIPRDVPVENREVTGVKVNKCVVAVPACYTAQQRAAILDAGEIAGVEILGLIDEGVASAFTYGTSRRHDLKALHKSDPSADQGDQYPETVVIIDMGHSFFNVSVSNIGYNRIKVRHSSSLNIGANNFQQKLLYHFMSLLKQKFNVQGELSARTRARMQRAVEKAMKVLSTVGQSHVEVENFQDGVDVREIITRAEFESFCSDLLAQVSSHVSEALKSAGVEPSGDLKVEIIGGGCRIPAVQSVIQQVTQTSQLRFTLDSNNAIAIGAAAYGSLVKNNGAFDLEDESFEFICAENENENIESFRLSAEALEAAKEFEKKMQERDFELRALQETRNAMEQFIYHFMEDLSIFRSEIPAEEALAIEPELEKQKEWLLYSDECTSCSLEDLNARFEDLKKDLAVKGPQLQALLEKRAEDKKKAEAEAAAAEANRTVTYRDKVKNPKTPRERVDAAIARKDQGNGFFKDLNYEHAVTRYLQAINLLAEVPGEKFKEEIDQTKLSCHLNLAMCYLQLKKYTLAEENCNMALRIDDKNVKGYFRRGKSKYARKLYEEAKKDFEFAVENDPSNTAAKKQVNLCDKQMKLQKEREKKMYQKMFS